MTNNYDELASRVALEVTRLLAADPVVQLEWFSTKQAARYLGVDPDYLQSLRAEGSGPKWARPRGVQRVIRYKRAWLDNWMLTGRSKAGE